MASVLASLQEGFKFVAVFSLYALTRLEGASRVSAMQTNL